MNAARKRTHRRGFTLIEALVSLVFVAIVSVALMRALVSTREAANETARRTDAEILMRALLAQVFAADRVPFGTLRGETRSYRWAIASMPASVPIPGDPPDSRWRPERVKVEVGWGANSHIAAETVRLVHATRATP
jgi:prepilin-type N-terminal cleavage/methylation domain-containing protein